MTAVDDTRTTSLTAAIDELRMETRQRLGDERSDVFDAAGGAEGARDVAGQALQIGDRAPLFHLPDARGRRVRLGATLERGPAVVLFYRGAWCPYCNLQLVAFAARFDELESAGATLLAISPQTPDNSLSFAEKAGLPFAVLSDVGNVVARRFGIVHRQDELATETQRSLGLDIAAVNGDDTYELPVPATFVIGRDGTVTFSWVEGDHRKRVGPEEVLTLL